MMVTERYVCSSIWTTSQVPFVYYHPQSQDTELLDLAETLTAHSHAFRISDFANSAQAFSRTQSPNRARLRTATPQARLLLRHPTPRNHPGKSLPPPPRRFQRPPLSPFSTPSLLLFPIVVLFHQPHPRPHPRSLPQPRRRP